MRALEGALRCVDVVLGRGRPCAHGESVIFVSTVWMAATTPVDPRVSLPTSEAVLSPMRFKGTVGSSPQAADLDTILAGGAEPMREGGRRRCAILADKAQAVRRGIPGVIAGADLVVLVELEEVDR
jgi:hypothetical protein